MLSCTTVHDTRRPKPLEPRRLIQEDKLDSEHFQRDSELDQVTGSAGIQPLSVKFRAVLLRSRHVDPSPPQVMRSQEAAPAAELQRPLVATPCGGRSPDLRLLSGADAEKGSLENNRNS